MATSRRPAPFRSVDAIEVSIWGERVGAVALDPRLGYYAFQYLPSFAASGIELAPLQMPLARSGNSFVFPSLPEETFRRLPALLADSLPDRFGNALVNRFMAERGLSASSVTALDRLAYMGARSMGALEFKPARGPAARKPTAIDLNVLVGAARSALHGTLDGDDETAQALRNLIEVGTSAGGARAKAVVAIHPSTQEMLSGQSGAPEGFEHWLLKFDGVGPDPALGTPRNYGRIEFAYHLMARAAGIEMTDCQLLEESGRAHFLTRRFDRVNANGKHHVQSLCAMAHLDFNMIGTNSYSQLFSVMHELNLPYAQLEEAFRRLVFNVLGRNCDDHSKNFAFILRQDKPWELSPAYDLTFAHDPGNRWTRQHLMSVHGKFEDLTLPDLLAEADRAQIGSPLAIVEQVRGAIARWPSFAREAGLDDDLTRRIQTSLLVL